VFLTTDGGTSWTAVNGSLSNLDVRSLTYEDDSVRAYAGTFGGGVFRTNNVNTTGTTTPWTAINGGLGANLTIFSLALDPFSLQTIYAGTNGGGVFKTINGGAAPPTWTAMNTGLPAGIIVDSIAIDPTNGNIVYIGTRGRGTFKTTDGGSTWSPTGAN